MTAAFMNIAVASVSLLSQRLKIDGSLYAVLVETYQLKIYNVADLVALLPVHKPEHFKRFLLFRRCD